MRKMNSGKKTFILTNVQTQKKIVLKESEKQYRCGRAKENEIVCLSRLVSRKHCIFFWIEGDLQILDANSSNGIYINGKSQQSNSMIKLNNNDVIGIGSSSLDEPGNEIKYIFELAIIQEKPSDVIIPKNNEFTQEKQLIASLKVPTEKETKCVLTPTVSEKVQDYEKYDRSNLVISSIVVDVEGLQDEKKEEMELLSVNNTRKVNITKASEPCLNSNKLEDEVIMCYDGCSLKKSDQMQPSIEFPIKPCTEEKLSNQTINNEELKTNKHKEDLMEVNIKMKIQKPPNELEKLESESINIKQEPLMEFSLLDYIELSDDESNCFPSSQLFQEEEATDDVPKIKTEVVNKVTDDADPMILPENEKTYHEEIIEISDNEHEEVTLEWIKKLSRSQEMNSSQIIVKIEKPNEEYHEQELNHKEEEMMEVQDPIEMEMIEDNIEQIKNDNSHKKMYSSDEKTVDLKHNHLNSQKAHPECLKRKLNSNETSNKSGYADGEKPTKSLRLNSTENKRGLQIIDPPHLTNDRHKGVSCFIKKKNYYLKSISEPEASTSYNSFNKDISDKILSRTEEKETRKQKDREYAKQEKIRRQTNKLVALPLRKKSLALQHTKEEKERIVNERKAQLKAIATEKKINMDKIEPIRRTSIKPKVKVSAKSRGDLLTESFVETTAQHTEKTETATEERVELKSYMKTNTLPSRYTIPLKKADQKNHSEIHPDNSMDVPLQSVLTCREMSRRNVLSEIPAVNTHTSRRTSILKESRVQQEKKTSRSSKKRVSFKANLTEIKTFEVTHNNTMRKYVRELPVSMNKLYKCHMDEFLMCIYRWNPIWLEEQQRISGEPPVVNQKELVPLLTQYKSFADYYTIMKPLLLLEMWHLLVKEFNNSNKPFVLFSFVRQSLQKNEQSNIESTTLLIEILVTKHQYQRQLHPTVGDLVYFEYYSAGKIYRVFGYVKHMSKTIITPKTFYNKQLQQKMQNPYSVITYTIHTKPLSSNPDPNRVQRLRSVIYLRSNLRMIEALQYLPLSPLVNQILKPKVDNYLLPNIMPPNKNYSLVTKDKLNDKQLEAVLKAKSMLTHNEAKICLIQGPPGTGKSKVIINIVTEIYAKCGNPKSPLKILLCAPSNAAVDELALRLLDIRMNMPRENRFRMVRIGRIEAMHPKVRNISLTEFAEREMKKNVTPCIESVEEEKRFLEAHINALNTKLATNSSTSDKMQIQLKIDKSKEKYAMLSQRNVTANEMYTSPEQHKYAVEKILLENANIIVSTLSSCHTKSMESIFGCNNSGIPVCIVDEATQSCEAETLIPLMLRVKYLILVGDSNQLPATVISQSAKKLGLDQSLFSRIQNMFENEAVNPVIQLTTQYRMADPILHWPNKYFYGSMLKSAIDDDMNFPFHAYRVLNLNSNQDDIRFKNTSEADFVANMIFCIMSVTYIYERQKSIEIGVITPYNDQRSLISTKIHERISKLPLNIKKKFIYEVNTVDSFQGQERDIIIMSCVRSDGIGFLSDRQRLCVALTRAKHSLFLCGNFKTFLKDPMWNALLTDARSRGIFIGMKADANIEIIKQHIAIQHKAKKQKEYRT